MNPESDTAYIAFDGDRCIAAGDLRAVARAAKETLDRRKDASILVFDGATSGPIEIDFRGSLDDVLARLPQLPGGRCCRGRRNRPHRAVPAARNWAWSRAKSRCCRGIGNGWRSNPAALRSRCANWSRRRGAPARTRTASGRRRKRPIVSCRRWPENKPHYEDAVARAVCSRCRRVSRHGRHPGPPMCATTRAGSPRPRFERAASETGAAG